MSSYVYIAVTVALTVFGQLLIKARAAVHAQGAEPAQFGYLIQMFLDHWVWLGLAAAVVASACWMMAVRTLSLGLAYPFVALSFAFVPLGAWLFFGDSFGWKNILAIALIVSGVALSANS